VVFGGFWAGVTMVLVGVKVAEKLGLMGKEVRR
jgi:hypothetical protein